MKLFIIKVETKARSVEWKMVKKYVFSLHTVIARRCEIKLNSTRFKYSEATKADYRQHKIKPSMFERHVSVISRTKIFKFSSCSRKLILLRYSFSRRAFEGHVLQVSSYNASSSSLEKKKKKETSERRGWSLPCFYSAPCEYRGPLFRSSEDSAGGLSPSSRDRRPGQRRRRVH